MTPVDLAKYIIFVAERNQKYPNKYEICKILYILQYTWIMDYDEPLMPNADFHAEAIGPMEKSVDEKYIANAASPCFLMPNEQAPTPDLTPGKKSKLDGTILSLLDSTTLWKHHLLSKTSLYGRTYAETQKMRKQAKVHLLAKYSSGPITTSMIRHDINPRFNFTDNVTAQTVFKINHKVANFMESMLKETDIDFETCGIQNFKPVFSFTKEAAPGWFITLNLRPDDTDKDLKIRISLEHNNITVDTKTVKSLRQFSETLSYGPEEFPIAIDIV